MHAHYARTFTCTTLLAATSEGTPPPSSEISRARELLAQAVEVLGGSIGSTSDSTPSPSGSLRVTSAPGAQAAPRSQQEVLGGATTSICASTSGFSGGSSSRAESRSRTLSTALSERNLLFNYDRKRSVSNRGGRKKKIKVAVWSHELICLADTEQVKTPSPYERSVLQAAGKFAAHYLPWRSLEGLIKTLISLGGVLRR